MPIFEYRCKKCGHVTEFLEEAGSHARHACEKCGGAGMEKVFSAFAARGSTRSASTGSSSCPTGTCPLS